MRSTKNEAKIKEISVEDYLHSEVKALGGFTVKLNPNWYIGIPDRLVAVCGYLCLVELKRPKGGRFSVPQKMWKKFCTQAGVPWHHLRSRQEVDDFLVAVKGRYDSGK